MIINKTKKVTLAEKVILADTPLKRMKGLLGLKKLNDGCAMVIKPCNSIHTFFMHFPIDVLFVGKDGKIVKAINSILPFHISPVCFRSCFVIELPAGVIRSTLTAVGDQLILE